MKEKKGIEEIRGIYPHPTFLTYIQNKHESESMLRKKENMDDDRSRHQLVFIQ
jgi:hypothetical protein